LPDRNDKKKAQAARSQLERRGKEYPTPEDRDGVEKNRAIKKGEKQEKKRTKAEEDSERCFTLS